MSSLLVGLQHLFKELFLYFYGDKTLYEQKNEKDPGHFRGLRNTGSLSLHQACLPCLRLSSKDSGRSGSKSLS